MNNIENKISYNKNLEAHLNELSSFWGRSFKEDDLIFDDKIKHFLNNKSSFYNFDTLMIKMVFDCNRAIEFKSYIDLISKIVNGECYFFGNFSGECGAIKIDSILDFDFNYSDNGGLVSFFWFDNANIVKSHFSIDWYLENNKPMLELELKGDLFRIDDFFKSKNNLHLCRYSKEEINLVNKIQQSKYNAHFPKGLYFTTIHGMDGKSQSEILELFHQIRFKPFYTWLYESSKDLLNKLNDKEWVENTNKILKNIK